MTEENPMLDLPDAVIRGPFATGSLEIDGKPFPYPVRKIGWEMEGGKDNAGIPILKIEIECGRIRIDQNLADLLPDQPADDQQ